MKGCSVRSLNEATLTRMEKKWLKRLAVLCFSLVGKYSRRYSCIDSGKREAEKKVICETDRQ